MFKGRFLDYGEYNGEIKYFSEIRSEYSVIMTMQSIIVQNNIHIINIYFTIQHLFMFSFVRPHPVTVLI